MRVTTITTTFHLCLLLFSLAVLITGKDNAAFAATVTTTTTTDTSEVKEDTDRQEVPPSSDSTTTTVEDDATTTTNENENDDGANNNVQDVNSSTGEEEESEVTDMDVTQDSKQQQQQGGNNNGEKEEVVAETQQDTTTSSSSTTTSDLGENDGVNEQDANQVGESTEKESSENTNTANTNNNNDSSTTETPSEPTNTEMDNEQAETAAATEEATTTTTPIDETTTTSTTTTTTTTQKEAPTSSETATTTPPPNEQTTPSKTASVGNNNNNETLQSAEGPFIDLFGPSLLSMEMIDEKNAQLKTHATNDALKGKKVIGLYFSADWCGPCRKFTPELVSFYDKMNSRRGKEGQFEIVWISRSRDYEKWGQFFAHMKWLAMEPQDAMGQKGAMLSDRFKVKGIPNLVLLDEMGHVITRDARNKIPEDRAGVGFPWRNPFVAAYHTLVPKALRIMIKSGLIDFRNKLVRTAKGALGINKVVTTVPPTKTAAAA